MRRINLRMAGMFLLVGFCFTNVFAGDKEGQKPFELKLIKEFKTGKEYEAYKKSHPEILGVKEKEVKRIRAEGDKLRFYDEKGNLIRERKIYKGKEVFEGKNKYGLNEKFKIFSRIHISPKDNMVLDQRWKLFLPEATYASVYKIIIYNEKGEITGVIDSLNIYPYILPASRYIIGINADEGWVDSIVYIYNTKGEIVKTIGLEIENNEIAYAIVSSDGGYALVCSYRADGSNSEIILIDKEANVIWRKKLGWSSVFSDADISSFGRYVRLSMYERDRCKIVVFDKKEDKILEKQVPYATSLHFIDNTQILAYVDLEKPVPTLILLDVKSGNILCEKPIEKIVRGAGIKMKVRDTMLLVGSSTKEGEISKEFGSEAPVYIFQWRASDEMFLKGGR